MGGVGSRSSGAGADAVGWSVGTGAVLVGGCVVAGAVVTGVDGSEEGVLGVALGVTSGVVVDGSVTGVSTTGTILSFVSVGCVGCVVGCFRGGAVVAGVLVGVGAVLTAPC